MTHINWDELFAAARAVAKNAHAPYSDYPVGAAILTRSGRLLTGCNVENATFGLTICAERAALVAMVASGERDPIALAVVTPGPSIGTCCGMCRQSLAEFAPDSLQIQIDTAVPSKDRMVVTLGELLPLAFRSEILVERQS